VPELEVNGRRIAYRAEGVGPLVLLLHCSSSHSGQWKAYVDAWHGCYRLVAPDWHGYGRTEPLPDDGRPFYVHDAPILPALIAAEGQKSAHVVGHSLGGALGFYATRDFPEMVRSLTMIEPVLFAILDEVDDAERDDRPTITRVMGDYIAAGDMEAAAAYFIDFWAGPGAWSATSPDLQTYIRATIGRVLRDWLGALPDAPGQIRLADGAGFKMPVELWRGSQSRPSARAIAGHIAASIQGAALHEMDGADHMAAVTYPDRFIGPIGDFLHRVDAAGQANTRED